MRNASVDGGRMLEEPRTQAMARTRSRVGRRKSRSGPYDTWTVLELRERARELGLTGYSSLTKSDLIYELRSH